MEFRPFETATDGVFPQRSQWDATAAELVGTMLRRWNLTPHGIYVGGAGASVLRVSRADGSPAVLKVGYPHVEAMWEAVGLEAMAPFAPVVLQQDAWTWSLLLEEVLPGTPLSRAGLDVTESLVAGGELLGRLQALPVPAGIPSLTDAMMSYVDQAIARMARLSPALEALGVHALVEQAIAMLVELAQSAPDTALLHGDYNPGNLLRGAGGGWRVIDPKPMHGDPAFDIWPLATQLGPHFESQLEIVATAAGVDVDRAAKWAFARTGINVSWYLVDGLSAQAGTEATALRTWAAAL